MIDELFEIVSNDYVCTYIALASFVISIINSIYLIFANSFKLSVISKSYGFCDCRENKPLFFELAIENNSRVQISVSRMFLIINDQKYEFQWEKERIGHTKFETNGVVTEEYSTYSLTLPQNIPGMGVIGGFFYVPTDNSISESDILNSTLGIEIHTNRGIKKIKLDMSKLPVHS